MKNKYSKEDVLNEIERNRNHSWFEEIKKRSKNHMSKTALRYRGLNISYSDYIDICEKQWAPALKKAGIKKGDTIVASIASTPEYCYLFGAASIVGARINLISSEFDEEYTKEIINSSEFGYVFIGEDRFNKLYPVASKTDKVIVPIELNNSLKNGNPFQDVTNKYLKYDINLFKHHMENIDSNSNLISLNSFLEKGKTYNGQVYEQSGLDDEFTITYSSGTTDGNKPKGIVHANRHYIVMGRYHDSEVSGIPNLKNSITYSLIPTQSNSYVASILSDTLMEGASIALDPVTDIDYFIYGLHINKPYMAIASTSTWINLAKTFYNMDINIRKKFDFSRTIFPAAVGEGLAPGEEKFLNKFLKDAKFGTAITKLPYSISKMSTCGGDCEHGSLFIRELRAYANIKKDRNVDEPIGLRTYDFVDINALRRDGTYCNTYEYGKLVANSACTMVRYENDPKRTSDFYVTDAYGKKWVSLNCYGFLDKDKNIYIKGRILDDSDIIPEFMITDEVQKDTKNILSCSTVIKKDNNNISYVSYIQPQPNSKSSIDKIVNSIIQRCTNKFGNEFKNLFHINILDYNESYPLTACLKRDNSALQNDNIKSVLG